MLGLIIFGTRGVTYGSDHGQFFCPDCEENGPYRHRKVRRFFTLYFIPVIPLGLLGEYVECQRCTSTYKLSVLDYDPAQAAEAEEAEFHKAVRRVLVMMMLADGVIEESELDAIQTILGKLEDREVTRAEIDVEITRTQSETVDIEGYCRGMAGYLNDAGREMVVKAAILVAGSDGTLHESEREALETIATALNMSRAHFSGVVADMMRDAPATTAPSGPPN
ncbi:MAG TPA: TerB family tellurite resistance protein [Kofleriaceae bacterium]|nr:TerB family tellurite resistance protein [Kofleriaceae bacterium]